LLPNSVPLNKVPKGTAGYLE